MNDIEADKSKNINFAIKLTLFHAICLLFVCHIFSNEEENDLNMYLAYMTEIAIWCQIYFIQNVFVENS